MFSKHDLLSDFREPTKETQKIALTTRDFDLIATSLQTMYDVLKSDYDLSVPHNRGIFEEVKELLEKFDPDYTR